MTPAELSRVASVHMYPIKSCHAATVDGLAPKRLEVGETGFIAHETADREFVVVDADLCVPVTQRGWKDPSVSRAVVHPEDRRLATVRVDIRPDHLTIVAPGAGTAEVGTEPVDGEGLVLDIFGKQFSCVDQGPEAARFFTLLLGRAVRLVRADRDKPRTLPERYQCAGAANAVAGADGFPFLLANQTSLDSSHQQNGFVPDAVPIARFRPNIVIGGEGVGAYEEDFARLIRIRNVAAYVVKACSRCPIPNVDQESGAFTPQTGLKVLRGRQGTIFTGETGLFFGQNLNHIYMPGETIGAGDAVVVLDRADERNVRLAAE